MLWGRALAPAAGLTDVDRLRCRRRGGQGFGSGGQRPGPESTHDERPQSGQMGESYYEQPQDGERERQRRQKPGNSHSQAQGNHAWQVDDHGTDEHHQERAVRLYLKTLCHQASQREGEHSPRENADTEAADPQKDGERDSNDGNA